MSFEGPIRQCIKDVRLGHILIQTNLDSNQPEVRDWECFLSWGV